MMENNMINGEEAIKNVPKRILSTLLASLAAGVVPRNGAPYIAIGRKDEIGALLSDLENVGEGGGALRFLIGRYGSGKSFLIQLIRGYALERGFVTADADLSPERRLYGTNGSGVATYKELVKNLATKASPDGGALSKMLVRWINGIRSDISSDGVERSDEEFLHSVNNKIFSELREMEEFVGGFDFAKVVCEYYKATLNDNEEKKTACLRWLRGEYATKTEARSTLGFSVSCIIDDDNWYDFIKLWAALSRRIGYKGLVVFIDECVNLYKISHRVSRENNYEKILSMFNDALQGRAPGLCMIFGGTPQFLEDTRRGLFGYEALRSRLCDSRFASGEYKNMIGPVIRLCRLTDDELFALITRVTKLYSMNYNWEARITQDEMIEFLNLCLDKAGADTMITPREMLRDYMTVLNILMQNEDVTFERVIGTVKGGTEKARREDEEDDDVPVAPMKKLSEDQLSVLEF